MRLFFLVLLALASLALSGCAYAAPPYEESLKSVVVLEYQGRPRCGATLIQTNKLLLTAKHCLVPDNAFLVKGKPLKVKAVLVNGEDMAFLFLEEAIEGKPAKLGPTSPRIGTLVYILGPAARENPQLRLGYRTGWTAEYGLPAGLSGKRMDLYDMEVRDGDSGSAIFDAKGRVIGVVSLIHAPRTFFRLMASFPADWRQKAWSLYDPAA